jgi:hypothetical protein
MRTFPARRRQGPAAAGVHFNLADNALRYNVPGGWAEISTATHDGRGGVGA